MQFTWNESGVLKQGTIQGFIFDGTEVYALMLRLSDGKLSKVLYTEITAIDI